MIDWDFSVFAFLHLITFLFKFEDMQSYLGYTFHFCYLSVLYFDCRCIFWMKMCYIWQYLSCNHDTSRHDTCLNWALPCITFCSGNICCMSLNICKDDIHDMWPVHMLLLELVLIWMTLTCRFKGQVQLTKWGNVVTFGSAYAFIPMIATSIDADNICHVYCKVIGHCA